jgi:hypothetical protein
MSVLRRWLRPSVACLVAITALCVVGTKTTRANTYYTINLQALDSGLYVVAEGGGNGAVNADRSSPGPWETFGLIDQNDGSLQSGDFVHIQTNAYYYFSATYCGGYDLNATGSFAGYYENFRIWKVGGSGTIGNGDHVALQTLCGYYVVAEGGGGGAVNANRTSIGGWETFIISM